MSAPGARGARDDGRRALEGALAMAAAMGVGRFAYTAMLPATQRALGVGDDVAGGIASVNLVGYLGGVLLARGLSARPARGSMLRVALAVTALTTALGAATTSTTAWAVLRGAAGLASGFVFVFASAAALEAAPARAGSLYAGVGLGIALSGAVAALVPGFAAPWLVLAAAAGALALPPWVGLAMPPIATGALRGAAPTHHVGLRRLSAAYFLEGLGYIVSGTFAVAAVQRTPGLEALAPWTWVITGACAAPSAVMWSAVGRRVGIRRALAGAFLLQAAGMSLPSLSRSAVAALAGAALFGGTFMGITTLAMAAARALAPEAPGRPVGALTGVYGLGQVLGPVLAGLLSRRLGDPAPAVLAAAAAVAIGGMLLWGGAAADVSPGAGSSRRTGGPEATTGPRRRGSGR